MCALCVFEVKSTQHWFSIFSRWWYVVFVITMMCAFTTRQFLDQLLKLPTTASWHEVSNKEESLTVKGWISTWINFWSIAPHHDSIYFSPLYSIIHFSSRKLYQRNSAQRTAILLPSLLHQQKRRHRVQWWRQTAVNFQKAVQYKLIVQSGTLIWSIDPNPSKLY